MNLLRKMWQDDEGQDLVEYALIVGLIAVALVAALTGGATAISNLWGRVVTQLNAA
jgi:pilus assembly protein Flp/PilA